MSLNFSLDEVKDQQMCWEAEEFSGKPTGRQVPTTLAETLIFLTMSVGMPRITEGNALEFYTRVATMEAVNGPFIVRVEDDAIVGVPITLEQVRSFVGLSTNASAKTATHFKRDVKALEAERAKYDARRAESDAALTETSTTSTT